MLLTEQLTELGWRFDPDEPRDAHGRWAHTGAGYTVPGHDRLIIPHPPKNTRFPYYRASEDHPFFRAHPVSSKNIVAAYDEASPEEKAQGMRWYADAHRLAGMIGRGDTEKGAGVLAAYSPQTPWPANMFNADKAVELGRALGPGDGMITHSMQDNAQRILDGEPLDKVFGKNKAPKIRAFAHLIAYGGDKPDDTEGNVVLDRHAMSVAMGVRLPKKESDLAPIGTDRYYQHVCDEYRKAALEVSKRGTPVAPHQMQAITWLRQQRKNVAEDTAGGAGHGGKGAGKGRVVMQNRAWDKWMTEAAADRYALQAGTTGLAGTIAGQLTDLAAWEHEPRAPDGRWVHAGLESVVSFHPGMYPSDADFAGTSAGKANAALKAKIDKELQVTSGIQDKLIPGISRNQKIIMTSRVPDAPPDPDEIAYGETMNDNTIYMVPDATGAVKGIPASRRMAHEQVDAGFWVPVDKKYTLAQVVAAHEEGHVIGNHLEKADKKVLLSPDYWNPLAKAMGLLSPVARYKNTITPADLADWAGRNSYALSHYVSFYGASNPYEMQGELWAEFTMSSHPRPPAVAFGKYVLSHLPAEDLPPKAASA